jgi:hypothetical protein
MDCLSVAPKGSFDVCRLDLAAVKDDLARGVNERLKKQTT